ncbi:MAG TPA: ion channel [Acetobacteraceae bacterium]|nr:ion channel [Acetobacteraceae bacterium]
MAEQRLAGDRPRKRAHRVRTMRLQVGAYSVETRGALRYDPRDPFYFAATLPWPAFLTLLFGTWIALNAIFAVLYLAVPGSIANARPGAYGDAFFFSVETLATVGYGVFAPVTAYGHLVATMEIFVGIAFNAIATGLMFLRFSRPKPRFVYAQNPIVALVNGTPTLMLRLANGRTSVLTDAHATMSALLFETTQEGQVFRRFHDLKLVRAHLPLFPIAWTLMHELGPDSPLYGMDAHWLRENDLRVFVTLIARDRRLGAVVHDARDYHGRDVRFGVRYADAVVSDKDGNTRADLTLISELEGLEPAE